MTSSTLGCESSENPWLKRFIFGNARKAVFSNNSQNLSFSVLTLLTQNIYAKLYWMLKYNTIQYNTIQYNTIQYNAI